MSANGNVDNRGFSRGVDDLCTVLYLALAMAAASMEKRARSPRSAK